MSSSVTVTGTNADSRTSRSRDSPGGTRWLIFGMYIVLIV